MAEEGTVISVRTLEQWNELFELAKASKKLVSSSALPLYLPLRSGFPWRFARFYRLLMSPSSFDGFSFSLCYEGVRSAKAVVAL